MLVLGFLHLRFSIYSAVAGVVLFPVGMTVAAERPQTSPRLLLKFVVISPLAAGALRLSLLLGFLLVPYWAVTTLPAEPLPLGAVPGSASCDGAAAAGLLSQAAGTVVLAYPNLTPELLYRTQILTVGSLYHRTPAAYMRLRAAWRAEPGDKVPEAVRATQAQFVLACKGAPRARLAKDLPKTTLLDVLSAGTPPAWLTPVVEDARSGFVLYRVEP
jgi:hypothetical protein